MCIRTLVSLVLGLTFPVSVALVQQASAQLPHTPGQPVPFVTVDHDAEMVAAITKARASIQEFWESLAARRREETAHTLKVRISDGKNTEYMWLGNVVRRGRGYVGTIDNDPKRLRNVKADQRYAFKDDDIIDWMFMRNGKMVGNETLRPLLKHLSPEVAAKYRAAFEKP